MAPDPPLTRLVLTAKSVVDDIGFVALGDLVSVVGAGQANYRVIGGHMVTALVARWGLGADLYRETGDTDLGVPPFVVEEQDLIGRLGRLGYTPIAGNRFARQLDDIPATLAAADSDAPSATVDVLIPPTQADPARTVESETTSSPPRSPASRSRSNGHRWNSTSRCIASTAR